MKAAQSVCTMAGIAVWTAGLLIPITGFAAVAPSLAGAYPRGAACTAPPAPDGKKKTVPEGHAKPSSYAPQPRPPNRTYGAPIQRPILSKHKRPKHSTGKPAPKWPRLTLENAGSGDRLIAPSRSAPATPDFPLIDSEAVRRSHVVEGTNRTLQV